MDGRFFGFSRWTDTSRTIDRYPLVNVYIANWKDPPFLMGKSTISTGPFSIAMLVYQRVSIVGLQQTLQQTTSIAGLSRWTEAGWHHRPVVREHPELVIRPVKIGWLHGDNPSNSYGKSPFIAGWWLSPTPLKNMKVKWDDWSQYMEKDMLQTTNQFKFGKWT